MDEAANQLQLVRLALSNGFPNCIHWASESLINRVRRDPDLQGLTPEGIVSLLLDYGSQGGEVREAIEKSNECRADFEFLFAVNITVEGLPLALELYIKMGIKDDDEEIPEVAIVSCHRSTFSRGTR